MDKVIVIRKKEGEGPNQIVEGPYNIVLDGDGPFEVPRFIYDKWLQDTFDVEE